MNLQDIPKTIEKINAKIKSLESKEGVEKVTLNATLPSSVKVKAVKTNEELVTEIAKISMANEAYNKSSELLGAKVSAYKHNGHTLEEWVGAAKWRAHELSVSSEIDTLKKTKSVLEKNMIEEDRKRKEIADAMKGIDLD